MKYSLVELAPLAAGETKYDAIHAAIRAAHEAEALGHHRIWYAEHHHTEGYAAQDPVALIAKTLTIKTPADVLSFIGHTLGFWPHESLVCITLADNHVGATLRVDLPKPGTEISYAHMVAGYLAHDAGAASVLFAVYTSEAQTGQNRPHAETIAALTGALAEAGMTIRDGLLVGDHAVSQYDGDPKDGIRLPLSATQSSQINAEFLPSAINSWPTSPESTNQWIGSCSP